MYLSLRKTIINRKRSIGLIIRTTYNNDKTIFKQKKTKSEKKTMNE